MPQGVWKSKFPATDSLVSGVKKRRPTNKVLWEQKTNNSNFARSLNLKFFFSRGENLEQSRNKQTENKQQQKQTTKNKQQQQQQQYINNPTSGAPGCVEK